MRFRSFAAFALAIPLAFAGRANAQSFPERPVRMIVPYAVGGGTDAVGRAVAESMSSALGQQIIIENMGGAGGMIGASKAARAAPDGYTILLHQPGLAAGPSLYPTSGLNIDSDFAGIGLVSIGPMMIVGRRSLLPDDFKSLVAWANETNYTLKFGHPGVGSMGHFCGELMKTAGAPISLVAYRGGGPALADTIGGSVDLTCVALNVSVEQIEGGTLKGYGITSREPSPAAPKAEALGATYPALDLPYWHALFAPAGTPKAVVDRLNGALRQSLRDPKVLRVFGLNGMTTYPEDKRYPAAATELLAAEVKRLGEVIRSNRIGVAQ